jgi:hypothetical protein
MQKYIKNVNDVLKYKLNLDHTTEKDIFLNSNPSLYLNDNILDSTYVNNNLTTILEDILQSDNIYYK